MQTYLRNALSNSSLCGILIVYIRINHMHRNILYSPSRHYINLFEVYNPLPSPKKECSDLKGTISSFYLLSFFVAPWIASLGPSGACGRAVWRLLGGPGDPLGGLWGRSWGGLGEVLGVLEGILDALPPKKAPRIPRGAPKSSPRHHQEAPRGPRRSPKGSEETVFEAPEAMKMR